MRSMARPEPAIWITSRRHMRPICAMALWLVQLASVPACAVSAPADVACGGTGVRDSTAAVSIDIGDLPKPEASATLHMGEELFVGSNGCGDDGLPSKDSVTPILVELSRHQQVGPGTGDGSFTLEVRYRAATSGRVVISITCRSDYCSGSPRSGSPIRLTVTVVASS